MNYYLFLDESGEANITTVDTRFNIFVLCGILFDADSYAIFNRQLDDVKLKFFGNKDVIFHSFEMRKNLNAFKIFQDKSVLSAFYEAMEPIFKNCNYSILSCVIHKNEYKEKYPDFNNAYEDALSFICERALSLIETGPKGCLHLCLEKRGKGKDSLLKKEYTKMVKYGTDYVSTAQFELCDPVLHFRGKDKNINGLQLADLCAYPIARKFLSPEISQPTFDIIMPKFFTKYGRLMGYGIKHFPTRTVKL